MHWDLTCKKNIGFLPLKQRENALKTIQKQKIELAGGRRNA